MLKKEEGWAGAHRCGLDDKSLLPSCANLNARAGPPPILRRSSLSNCSRDRRRRWTTARLRSSGVLCVLCAPVETVVERVRCCYRAACCEAQRPRPRLNSGLGPPPPEHQRASISSLNTFCTCAQSTCKRPVNYQLSIALPPVSAGLECALLTSTRPAVSVSSRPRCAVPLTAAVHGGRPPLVRSANTAAYGKTFLDLPAALT